MRAWLDKITEVDAERRGFLRLAAKGRMTEYELDEALAELEETRDTAEKELEALQRSAERAAELERDKNALLKHSRHGARANRLRDARRTPPRLLDAATLGFGSRGRGTGS